MKKVSYLFLTAIVGLVIVSCEGRVGRIAETGPEALGPVVPTKVDQPVINPSSGSFPAGYLVEIGTATEGATIRYTTDGSAPDQNSPTYTAPIELSTDQVKAIAIKEGLEDSEIAASTYTVQAPYSPNFTPSPTVTYNAPVSVTLTVPQGDHDEIRYTTDGSVPTATTGTVYSTPVNIATTGTTIKAVSINAGVASTPNTATYTLKTLAPTITHVTCPAVNPACPAVLDIDDNFSTKVGNKIRLINELEAAVAPTPTTPLPASTLCTGCIKLTAATAGSTMYWRIASSGIGTAPAWVAYCQPIKCSSIVPTAFNAETYATKSGMQNSAIGSKAFTK